MQAIKSVSIYFSAVMVFMVMVFAFSWTTLAQEAGTTSSTFPAPMKAEGKSELKPHVGILMGMMDPSGRSAVSGDFGVDVGFQPYVPFGLGMELAGYRAEDADRARLLVRGTYNFGGTIPVIRHSYVGAGIGATMGSDRTLLTSAPMVGFDIPVWDINPDAAMSGHLFTLGLHAKLLITEGSEPDAFAMNGVVKYWF